MKSSWVEYSEAGNTIGESVDARSAPASPDRYQEAPGGVIPGRPSRLYAHLIPISAAREREKQIATESDRLAGRRRNEPSDRREAGCRAHIPETAPHDFCRRPAAFSLLLCWVPTRH